METPTIEICFGEIGSSLGTRAIGEKIRHDIEHSILCGQPVVLNFDGVQLVSHSFADECIAKLLDQWSIDYVKKMTSFVNADSKVRSIIAFALRERLSEHETALTPA